MKKQLLAPLLLMIAFFISGTLTVHAQAPVFNSVTPVSSTVQKLEKFEVDISLTAAFTNAYDYDDIAVQGIFTAPSGKKDTVDGFYMQNYLLNTSDGSIAAGATTFKLRYAPAEAGTWSYVLSCTNTAGTTVQPAQTFTCTTSANPGFIRRNSSNYLSFDNGTQYIPVGQNQCWQGGNVYNDYTSWLTKLAANGGNFIRIWMSDWAFSIEWKNGTNGFAGLKKYKQSSAFWLDWLLDYCKQKNIYVMLCMNHHGQVSTTVNPEWVDNPYNTANGGPCANTWDFFSNATAIASVRNRQRYLVARYGYSTSLQSWELFNEVDLTSSFTAHKTEVTSWHSIMSTQLKEKDVYKHLVSTSYSQDVNDAATWNLPYIDFTQTHYYVTSPNIESVLSAGDQSYLSQFGKPTINAEFGISGSSGTATAAMDPNGLHIHNSAWASAFSGAMGSAMTWWWDTYVDPQNLYGHYKPLAQVLSGVPLMADNFKKSSASTAGGGVADLGISPGAGYGKSPASNFTIDAAGGLTPGSNQLSSFVFGNVFNTQNRNPPTFNITYPVAGQFKVVLTSGTQGSSPKINISLDGTELLNQNAVAGATYTINVPAGAHAIKVDNLGTDWINVSSYVFTNAGSPLTVYNLKAANSSKAAGWILNNQYNWKYLQDHGGAAPPVVTGATASIAGMVNANYLVNLYNCTTGALVSTMNVPATNGTVQFVLPAVAWDLAYTAIMSSDGSLPLTVTKFYGESEKGANKLYLRIEDKVNVKEVTVERSGDGKLFEQLGKLDALIVHSSNMYTDVRPLDGNNYYRLKITDNNGSFTYSSIVLLKAGLLRNISLYPNPVVNTIGMNLSSLADGMYAITVTDINGHLLISKNYMLSAGNRVISIPVKQFAKGAYIINVKDSGGASRFTQQIMKN